MNGIPDNSTEPNSPRKWWLAIVCTYAIYVLVYASVCLRTGLHWDEVLDYDGSAYGTYIAAGRWLTGAWRAFSGSWEPAWLPGFASGLVLCALVCAQASMLGLRDAWKKRAFIILYFGSIQWASMLHYSFLVESIAIGMCCATAAAWLCFKPGWKYGVAAVLLLGVALGAYQTLALYFGVAWLLLRLSGLRRGEEACSLHPWIRMACISAGGIAVWYAVHRVSLLFVPQEVLDYVQQYQEGISQWGTILSPRPLEEKAMCLAHYFKASVCNALGVGTSTYWLFAASVLPLVGIIWQALRGSEGWRRWEQCLDALLIWWGPFSLTAVLMTAPCFHTALAAPLSLAGLWMAWLAGARLARRHAAVLAITGAVLVAAGSVNVYAQAKEEASLHRNTVTLLHEMQTRGKECAKAAGEPGAGIVVLAHARNWGTPIHGAYPVVVATDSMEWYCRAYGINGIHFATAEEEAKYGEEFAAMPVWPAPGSVQTHGGIVIIKLTEPR